jgi:hypothetical protein
VLALWVDAESPQECPADFDRILVAFAMPVTGFGMMTAVLDREGKNPVAPGLYPYATEAGVVAAATRMLRSSLGPELPDGHPAYNGTKLAGWNLCGETWPLLCTKWLSYSQACESVPYRAMMQDPAQKWLSHPCLLSVDAIYRQGRALPKGYCEVDPALAMRYLTGNPDVPTIEPTLLWDAILTMPGDGTAMVKHWLEAVESLVWRVCGDCYV